jgi:hypothetical protein
VVTWGKVEKNLAYHENRLIANFHDHPIACVHERLKEFLEELRNFQLLPWQVLVSKMYRYAVKANSKRCVEWIDHEVLYFLSRAQDGPTVPTPDINEWADGMLNIMSEDKEYSELKKANQRPKDVAPTGDAVVVTAPLQVNAVFTKSCEQCNSKFQANLEHYKRCGQCQTEWRKTHPHPDGPPFRSTHQKPVMMVTPVENQLDGVYSAVENNYRNGKYVMTVNINQSDQKRVSAAISQYHYEERGS